MSRLTRQHQAERIAGRRGDAVGKRIAQRWSREARKLAAAEANRLTPAEEEQLARCEAIIARHLGRLPNPKHLDN